MGVVDVPLESGFLLSVLGSLLVLPESSASGRSRAGQSVGEAVWGPPRTRWPSWITELGSGETVSSTGADGPSGRFRGRRSGSGAQQPEAKEEVTSLLKTLGRGGLPRTEVVASPGSTRPTPLRWGWGGCPRPWCREYAASRQEALASPWPSGCKRPPNRWPKSSPSSRRSGRNLSACGTRRRWPEESPWQSWPGWLP